MGETDAVILGEAHVVVSLLHLAVDTDLLEDSVRGSTDGEESAGENGGGLHCCCGSVRTCDNEKEVT